MGKYLLLVFCFFFCFLSAQIPTSGLLYEWPFTGNADDASGNDNNGRVYNATLTTDRFGNSNSAYSFNGINSYILMKNAGPTGGSSRSVSFWLQTHSSLVATPFAYGSSKAEETIAIQLNYNCAGIGVDIGNGAYTRANNSISNGAWHHIVVVYDSAKATTINSFNFYIDGVLLSSNCWSVNESAILKTNADYPITIGKIADGSIRYFDGNLDDFYVYNRALSQAEVLQIYTSSNPNVKYMIYKWLPFVGAALLIILLTIVVLNWRNKRLMATEREKIRLNARMLELETKSIRSQMNPHFIFNSLNSLQRFILEEDLKTSHQYLTKFSRLLRKLLETSSSDSISLNEEIDILNMFITLEKARFSGSFTYEIRTEIKNPENVFIPFMMIQPFVENAIWHGLIPKKGERKLEITFSEISQKSILCVIEDNGVGRDFTQAGKSVFEKRSMAITLIKQRLELLEKSYNIPCSLKIIDKKTEANAPTGTRIEINIPKISA